MKEMIFKSQKSVQAVMVDMLSKTADIISPHLCASTCFAKTFSVMFYFMHLETEFIWMEQLQYDRRKR